MKAVVLFLRNGFVFLALLRLTWRADWHAGQAERHQKRAADHFVAAQRLTRRIGTMRRTRRMAR